MLLVTFSGLDGSGKSTHAARTAKYLAEREYCVHVLATASGVWRREAGVPGPSRICCIRRLGSVGLDRRSPPIRPGLLGLGLLRGAS